MTGNNEPINKIKEGAFCFLAIWQSLGQEVIVLPERPFYHFVGRVLFPPSSAPFPEPPKVSFFILSMITAGFDHAFFFDSDFFISAYSNAK